MERKRHSLSQTQYIACGFLVLILIGTGLLMLPFASRSGESMRFYGDKRYLCDRAGGGGYLESMDFVWTDGDYLSDSDRRFGVYFDWRICVDNSQA